ncbi:MAG: hypothetical protein ABS904_00165 [Solibacillus isronensis]
MEFQVGDKVVAYIPEIDTYARGIISKSYNQYHSYVNFGNFYFSLVPNVFENEWCISHKNLQQQTLAFV